MSYHLKENVQQFTESSSLPSRQSSSPSHFQRAWIQCLFLQRNSPALHMWGNISPGLTRVKKDIWTILAIISLLWCQLVLITKMLNHFILSKIWKHLNTALTTISGKEKSWSFSDNNYFTKNFKDLFKQLSQK